MSGDDLTDLASAGFNNGDRYQRGRPDYPADAITYLSGELHLAGAQLVVDVGAGTGIFSRQIAPLCRTLIAVEPSESMRATFRRHDSTIEVVEGRDVSLPFEDHSVDVITVAQAFHWFEPVASLAEFSRVLVRGGRIALIWNERDESVPWVARLSHAMQWDARQPYDVGMDFTPILERGPFEHVERRFFRHSQLLSRAILDQRVLTTSYIAHMSSQEQAAILRDVNDVVKGFAEPINLPYITTTYVATLRSVD